MNPCGVFESNAAPLSPRRPFDAETTVGLFANDKKNADVLLIHLQHRLEEDLGLRRFRWFKKDATRPAAFPEEFLAECDVVAAAVCD